jgi:hypothetical protein
MISLFVTRAEAGVQDVFLDSCLGGNVEEWL